MGARLGRGGLSLGEIVFAAVRPSGLVLLLLAAGLLLLPFVHRVGVWLLAIGALGFVVVGVFPVGAAALRPLEARAGAAALTDPPDGIVVLGGYSAGVRANDGRYLALTEAGERLTTAAELALRFPEARLVIAGNPVGPGRQSGAALSAALLERFGIARERMVLEDRSLSTWDNARHAFESAKPLSDERYVLVTSAFHMPRALATFRSAGWPALVPYPVDHRVPVEGGWRRFPPDVSGNLGLADLAAREWVATGLYRLLGRIPALVPPDPGPDAP